MCPSIFNAICIDADKFSVFRNKICPIETFSVINRPLNICFLDIPISPTIGIYDATFTYKFMDNLNESTSPCILDHLCNQQSPL